MRGVRKSHCYEYVSEDTLQIVQRSNQIAGRMYLHRITSLPGVNMSKLGVNTILVLISM